MKKYHQAWTDCLKAVTKLSKTDLDNKAAIKVAIKWLKDSKKLYPMDPPTCVIRDPANGLIIERKIEDCICELTFHNDKTIERIDYFKGKIVKKGAKHETWLHVG